MFKYGFKRNVFIIYFISYIFITAVPIFASRYLIQNYLINNYSTKVIEQNIKTCYETKELIDSNLIQFKKIVSQIENAKVFSSQYIKENKTAFLDIVPILNMFKNMNNMLYDIVYIDNSTNTIFSSYGQWNPEFYIPYTTITANKSDALDFISFKSGEYFVPSNLMSDFLGFDQLIEYVIPIRNSESVLIFKILEPIFGRMMQAQIISSASSFVLDVNNCVIYQSGSNYDKEYLEKIVRSLNGSVSNKATRQTRVNETISLTSNKDNFIIELNSFSTPIKYIFSMAYDDVMFDVKQIQNLFFFSYTVISALCIVLIFCLTKFNYRPVKKLINSIKGITSTVPGEFNEFKIIEHTIDDMYKKNKQLKIEINSALKEKILLKLIGQEYAGADDIKKECAASGIYLSNPYYGIFITMIKENIEKDDACKINNTIELLLQEYMDVHYIQYIEHNIHIFVISPPNNSTSKLKAILNQIIIRINTMFKRDDVVVGVGNIYNSLNDLFKSFNEAKIAIKCKYRFNSDNIFIYNQLNALQKNINYYPDIEIKGLYNSIISQNADKVEFLCVILVNIIKNEFSGSVISICLCHDVLNTILKAAIYINKFTWEIEEIYKSLYLKFDFWTIDEFVYYIKQVSNEITKHFDKNNDTGQITIEKILDYIEKNISNPDLSVSHLAYSFNISLSSLSRLFKENTGINISDYINKLRIKYAKMLLLSTDTTINEISQMLGYTQSSSFIRKFKQTEGVTPNEYRYQSAKDSLQNSALKNMRALNEFVEENGFKHLS